jgi:hypothetical protein
MWRRQTKREALTRLQEKWSRALETYIDLAKQGCELLCRINEVPIRENDRNHTLLHRMHELHAHAD